MNNYLYLLFIDYGPGSFEVPGNFCRNELKVNLLSTAVNGFTFQLYSNFSSSSNFSDFIETRTFTAPTTNIIFPFKGGKYSLVLWANSKSIQSGEVPILRYDFDIPDCGTGNYYYPFSFLFFWLLMQFCSLWT